MNIKRILCAVVFLFALQVFSQTADTIQTTDTVKYWTKGGTGSLNFTQVSLTNWAAGGESNVSGTALLNLTANYKKDKTYWDNTLDLGYGMTKVSSFPLKKNEDKIEFTSKWGHKTKTKWYYSTLVNFKSQFADGFNYPNDSVPISRFAAPAYLLVSIGMDYKPNDDLSLFVSPVTGKITFVNDTKLADAGEFGVEPARFDSVTGILVTHGKRIRYEFGAMLSFKYQRKLGENVLFKTKLDLFTNYLKNPGNIDVNWDVNVNMKINKYLAANVSTSLIYDDDIRVPVYRDIRGVKTIHHTGPRVQFKEVLAIGFSYKF